MSSLESNIEEWRDIVGYEGLYQASNQGNIRSLGRTIRDSIGRVRKIRPKLLNPNVSSKRKNSKDIGYLQVRLTLKNGDAKNHLVHRLVAEAFIENVANKPTVNHKDGDKHNNNIENLEWATYSENNYHAYDNYLKTDNRQVVRTNERGKIVGVYKSIHEASRETGVDYRKIHKLCNAYDKYDGEYYWDYIENFAVDDNTIYFAKTKDDAIIPTREEGSAGYDFYANIESKTISEKNIYEQLLKKGEVNFISTGVASALSDKFSLNFKNERSSFAKYGATILAGLIDSNYRGEIKIMVLPLVKNILLTSEVENVEEYEDVVFLPINKAVAQATVQEVPHLETIEISPTELKQIPSERGEGGWGSSGK